MGSVSVAGDDRSSKHTPLLQAADGASAASTNDRATKLAAISRNPEFNKAVLADIVRVSKVGSPRLH